MFAYLDRCYDKDAKESLKELRQLLGQYDVVDAQEKEIKSRIDREIEKRGPDSSRLKKLDQDLEKLAKKREKLAAEERELRDLALKAMEAAPAGADK
jgi:hypothetical protein